MQKEKHKKSERWDGTADLKDLKKIYLYTKILKALEKGSISTSALLSTVRSWGYGYGLLKELELKGLITRIRSRCRDSWRICTYNSITERGREFLKYVSKVLEVIGEDE